MRMRWPAGVDIFNKERLRVYPFGSLNGRAFDGKDERALRRALQSCMDMPVSFFRCLVNSAENMGTKKARSGASAGPRLGAGSEKIDSC